MTKALDRFDVALLNLLQANGIATAEALSDEKTRLFRQVRPARLRDPVVLSLPAAVRRARSAGRLGREHHRHTDQHRLDDGGWCSVLLPHHPCRLYGGAHASTA